MVWCEENRYLFGLAKNDRPSADIKLELAMNAGRFDGEACSERSRDDSQLGWRDNAVELTRLNICAML